jgi:hypothetical protein
MNETTLNLIQAMANGDALETEQTFGVAMAEKLAVKLDDMRAGVAQNMFNQEQQETFVEEDFQWVTEEEYLQLTEEEQEEYLTEEQLDELMGKGSLEKIQKAHQQQSSYHVDGDFKRRSKRTDFHGHQDVRAGAIISKRDTRAKYGKDAQHHHEYGSRSKRSKTMYARLSPDAKKKVTKTLGKEYTGKDKAPNISTKGKTTIHNPHTKAQQHDSAVTRTKTRAEYGLDQLHQDKETIKGGRD